MNAEIDISNVILKTERLTLRPWRHEDLDDFYEYARVDGVGQMAGWLPHESREVSAVILARFISGKKTFAIEYNGKAIGSLGVEKYDENVYPEFNEKRCREIGFVLSKDYWGRGFMPEAVNEVLRWLFEDMELDAVFCGHFKTNSQSARVQEKCGFRHHSFGMYETSFGTVLEDERNYLTRGDWLRRNRD